MHAVLRLEQAVGVVACDGERRALDPRLFPRTSGRAPRPSSLCARTSELHPHQHHRPVARVDAARARGDLYDRAAVVGSPESMRRNSMSSSARLTRARPGSASFADASSAPPRRDRAARRHRRARAPAYPSRRRSRSSSFFSRSTPCAFFWSSQKLGLRRDAIELFDLQALVFDVKVTPGARPPSRTAP